MNPISSETIDDHISKWSTYFKGSARSNWPYCLYHTTHIDNAVSIIRNGHISSRNHLTQGFVDCANSQIVSEQAALHDYVRLYFRPRNKFHFRTEGIRSLSDPYRNNSHMPIPVIFAIDLRTILQRDDIFFSNRRISSTTDFMFGEEQFKVLNFSNIYHLGPFTAAERSTVEPSRQSEVFVPKSLSLSNVYAILCRTESEKQTLIWKFGATPEIQTGIFVDPQSFEASRLHFTSLYLKNGDLSFNFRHPRDSTQNTYAIRFESNNVSIIHQLNATKDGWIIRNFAPGEKSIRLTAYIEESLAFDGMLHDSDSVF